MRWVHLSTSLTIEVTASLQLQLQGQRSFFGFSRVIVSHRRKPSGTKQAFYIHRIPALGLKAVMRSFQAARELWNHCMQTSLPLASKS